MDESILFNFPDFNDRLRGCNGFSDSLIGSNHIHCSFQGSFHGCRNNIEDTSG